jgi:sirohydrochlorin ferrochelatase
LRRGDPISRDQVPPKRTVGAVGGTTGARPAAVQTDGDAPHAGHQRPDAPVLIAIAHGSRDPAAAVTIEAVLARARALRPGLTARAAYLEIVPPAVTAALAGELGPVVALPLLLSTGYHAAVDIPAAVAATRPDATVGAVLGPHPLLAEALSDRLRDAGWRPADAVVLAAAGSADPAAAVATEAQARLLGARIGTPVTVGYVSAREPSVAAAVATARQSGMTRVTVASYLLAPGLFQASLAVAGADLVTAPLGDHDGVVRLLLHRYDEACSAG